MADWIPFLVIVYAVVAIAIPVVATIEDCPHPDLAVFIFACWFGILWPLYAPFVLLWFLAKLLGKALRR